MADKTLKTNTCLWEWLDPFRLAITECGEEIRVGKHFIAGIRYFEFCPFCNKLTSLFLPE